MINCYTEMINNKSLKHNEVILLTYHNIQHFYTIVFAAVRNPNLWDQNKCTWTYTCLIFYLWAWTPLQTFSQAVPTHQAPSSSQPHHLPWPRDLWPLPHHPPPAGPEWWPQRAGQGHSGSGCPCQCFVARAASLYLGWTSLEKEEGGERRKFSNKIEEVSSISGGKVVFEWRRKMQHQPHTFLQS